MFLLEIKVIYVAFAAKHWLITVYQTNNVSDKLIKYLYILAAILSVILNIPGYTPISPRVILVPTVPDLYIWLIGRISGKAIGDLQTITGNHLGRSGKVWRNCLSPTRVGYRKSDRLNMFKNSSRPESVGPRSSW